MTQGPLPLILLSAREHPDFQFRERIWSILEAWLTGKAPRFDAAKASSLLETPKGTFIEPFVLSGEDIKLASFLLRLALSKQVDLSRFRIVGEDTIGNEGGLVITRKGNFFYSERFAFGKNKLKNNNHEPNRLPSELQILLVFIIGGAWIPREAPSSTQK